MHDPHSPSGSGSGLGPAAPDPLRRAGLAPAPRTLVDVVRETAAQAGDAPALDTGVAVLTYDEMLEAAARLAAELAELGLGRGDRIGVRVPSGTLDLYLAVLGVLLAGAAYVPVDFEDPDERARLVFDEADVAAVVGADLVVAVRPGALGRAPLDLADDATGPEPEDDCWIIFTSGSTGTPKGVAVTHRSAAAFVDAEARWFLADAPGGPLGVGDRVMAGLSVAFDASCEEMWLAWRHGACLVPAPRALVRSGLDVGPWLVANRVSVVSTVPTLVAMWPEESLAGLRLLILGGEAVPPELVPRLVAPGREVWNTYGPTEATVVACGARLEADGPVRIGLPLDGWDLAVVDPAGEPVGPGETGELIIGGVGLARYLDPAKDAEKYAPHPQLGWARAYRSGDLVVNDPAGLLFGGRADDQVKVGGRRIELGEIDSALLALPGVVGAAAAVRRTEAGTSLLVGYVLIDAHYDADAAIARLRTALPAPLVPRLAVVDTLPTRTSGKVDRDALPWPLARTAVPAGTLTDTEAWVAELWMAVLGADVTDRAADFFDLGGGSLAAAQLVTRLRTRFPDVVVGDLYEHAALGALAGHLDSLAPAAEASGRPVPPIPVKTQAGQLVALVALRALAVPRWLWWTGLGAALVDALGPAGLAWVPTLPMPLLMLLGLLVVVAPVRMLIAAGLVRLVLRGVGPGRYPRGGKVHLRIWLAERIADELGATGLGGAPFMTWYARRLGARVGRDVDLHSLPPVTGMLVLGDGCSVEPEVDLSGHWIEGQHVHVAPVAVGARARVGARSMLLPGASVGDDAEVAPGSAVVGAVPAGEYWAGSPAARQRPRARGPWSEPPAFSRRAARAWGLGFAAAAVLVAGLPVLAIAAATLLVLAVAPVPGSPSEAALAAPLALLPGVVVALVVLAALVALVVRVAGLAITAGVHPVRSRTGLAVWTTVRVLDDARTWLFPLYSSSLTPAWLRLLGARVGRDVEASTVLLVPSLTQVNDQAFLADDTLIGGYELGGGWLRVERVKIGKRAFVGNSGMAAPGRKVPKASLVAVLSAAPRRKAARSGESWLGSPPAPLRRTAEADDDQRTFAPPTRLRVLRALVEAARLVPVALHAGLVVAVVLPLLALLDADIAPAARALSVVLALPVLLMAAGLTAALLAVAAKWLLVGRVRPGTHPLWSGFVWRNELADTFVESLAAPWFARAAAGTPALTWWLRRMGARIGRGVWCDSYWLPEVDLVRLGDGVTVNVGTVVQTHLFHDRRLALDVVTLERGATLGPHGVVLPAATIGRHATVGPVSLVMRGESVPDRTRWMGNPIAAWPRTGSGAAASPEEERG
ncbi:Pls/PosA family non-ribosomal peptide synthetase [Nocardioides sp.]|uniref:Pls/PosA family non-ribosomal peptide synthetase n=1 Tax=Nocardioides sp. TaxID=35761 RepID=UPI003513E8B7